MSINNICAIGKLDIDLNLTLRKSEAEYFKFNISDYNKVEDLKQLFFPNNYDKQEESYENNNDEKYEKPNINYLNYISLSSQDKFTNILLFINRAFKEKLFVELILLNKIEFSEERQFIKTIIEQICGKNYFFIIENKIYDIPSKINFKIQILEDDNDNIIESKIFQIIDSNEIPDEIDKNIDKNLFYKLNYNFSKCNFFLSNFDDMIKIEDESPYDIALFYKLLLLNNSKLKIITNISKDCVNESSDTELINSLKKIIDLSDCIISDRFTLNHFYEIYYSIFKNQKEINNIKKNKKPDLDYIGLDNEKKRKNIERTTILIDNLTKVKIYKQEGAKMEISYEEEYNCNEIYKENKEVNKNIINQNYNYYLSIFIGSFLSRFLHDKTFKTCINAATLSLRNMIELTKRNINYIIDLDFYNVIVSTKKKRKNIIKKKKALLEIEDNKKKENGFNLGFTNLNYKKPKEYNALLDKNCCNFLSSQITKNHLLGLGFINKKGKILKDPDKLVIVPHFSQKRLLRNTNLNFRFKPSPIKNTKTIENDYEYFNNKNKNKSEDYEIQKLKKGLNGKFIKHKLKLPPMLNKTYYFYLNKDKDYSTFGLTKNSFFSNSYNNNIIRNKYGYLKKKEFLQILDKFENKSNDLIKTDEK